MRIYPAGFYSETNLAGIEDQKRCPSWLREHTHRTLARMWRASNSKRGSPAIQACDLLLSAVGGLEKASGCTFINACASANGLTPSLEVMMNE